jgi:hypothetical protein
LVIKTILGISIANFPDNLPYYLWYIDIAIGSDFSKDYYQPGSDGRLAGHPAVRVMFQNGVQNGI